MISFKFEAEELRTHEDAPVGSMLFRGGRAEESATTQLMPNSLEAQHVQKMKELRDEPAWPGEWSVVVKMARTWACFPFRCVVLGCYATGRCCGVGCYNISLTRAQWIWACNLVCALAHGVMTYLIFTSCNGTRFGVKINPNCTAAAMEIKITRFSANWTSSRASGYTLMTRDNEMPIRFDHAAGWFHALSLIFHAAVVVGGPFDAFSWIYWKQLDRAFCWW